MSFFAGLRQPQPKHEYVPKEWVHLATCPDCGTEFYRDRSRRRKESHPRLWELSEQEKQALVKCRHGKVVCGRCGRMLSAEDSVERGLGPVCCRRVPADSFLPRI